MINSLKKYAYSKKNSKAIVDLQTYPNNVVTWEELHIYSSKIANFIEQNECKRIAIILNNCCEWITIFLSIIKSGNIAIPINPRKELEDIRQELDTAECDTIFVDWNIADNIFNICQNKMLVTVHTKEKISHFSYEDIVSEKTITNNLDKSDLCKEACIYFSSGTTGKAKAVVLTLQSLVISGMNEVINHGQMEKDVFLCAAPLYHIGALVHWLGSFFTGGLTIMYEIKTPKKTIEIIANNKVSITWMLLPWVQDIISAIENGDLKLKEYNLSLWRLMHMGAQPIPFELIEKWKRCFPLQQFDVNYGLTESTGPGCIHVGIDRIPKKFELGIPGVGWKVGIYINGVIEQVANVVGEIVLKGPTLMKEYYNDFASTNRVLCDGWLFTGDLGYLDFEGRVYYAGRKKDIIIVGGENIYPIEIENYIKLFYAIKDVAVIGIPNKRLGEIIIAIVELKECYKDKMLLKQLKEYCRKLPLYKRPMRLYFDVLPRNSIGKIDKNILRSKYSKK